MDYFTQRVKNHDGHFGPVNDVKGRAKNRRREWTEPSYVVDSWYYNNYIHPGTPTGEEYKVFDVTPQQPNNGLTIVELFAGGGLMAAGLKTAGFNLIWANDFNKNAVKAYQHNLGNHITLGDITAIDPATIPDSDVIAGGPPCQDFSVAGKGEGEAGERGRLVWAYLDIIKAKMPKAFIFENVKGLITKKHRPTFDALLEKFAEIGYLVNWQLINAWDYGVAQKRERVFIVGIRQDLGFTYQFPQPRPEDYRTQVLRDVIGDLPEPNDRKTTSISPSRHDTPNNIEQPSKTIVASTTGGKNCFNHGIKDAWNPPSKYTYGQANRPQDINEPCNTIPAHHNSGQPQHPIHAPRRFTVRECLRIQSAPDWYIFPDDMSLSAMYTVVGNGVACRVAWYLGQALAEQLKGMQGIQNHKGSQAKFRGDGTQGDKAMSLDEPGPTIRAEHHGNIEGFYPNQK